MASTPWWSCGALPDLVAPRLVSQRCSASPGSAPMRVCRKCSFGSFAAQSPRPLPLLVRGIEERFVSQSSTWLLVGKAGWLASGTRGRLICQLRQFGPPLCGPPYRRPPAESSHGSHGRRALFQELLEIYIYIIQFFPLFLLGYSVPDRTGTAQDYRLPLSLPLPPTLMTYIIYNLFPPDCDCITTCLHIYVGAFVGRAR